ncbi:MAG: ABC transporter ATP-binding protein [Spirochaetaceae bacterium]|nr:ABC transporter ATP-binding protein [Spirochaetaceae bacterium]
MNDAALEFKDFSFRYRSQSEPTLRNINLRFERGEKVLILGPSGSGKSTLIHCINGLIPHAFKGEYTGTLTLLGKDIFSLGSFEISKKAGTVLQDTDGQFVGLSAAEDIAFALENDCTPPAEMYRRVREAAVSVGMEEYLAKAPQDLSGGQKQRVSIAGVLVDNVEILLFDEPLANLDPATGEEAVELIDSLHRGGGRTIIIVEHRLEDVLHRPVDRIVVIDGGRIAADQSPEALLSSGLLRKTGIREPLYLSALRYAGITVDPGMGPQSLDTLNLDYGPLRSWDRSLARGPETPVEDEEKAEGSGVEPAEDTRAKHGGSGKPAPDLLEVRDIRFRYSPKDEEALKGISFSVARGECIALVGKNGSGKSTMAKCICGFVRPDSGAMYFEGLDMAGLSIMQRAEKIGYVMQNPNQMISFPLIYDEVALGLRTRGAGEAEIRDRVYDVLRICGLYSFRNWPVSALSYGQKKRLTIASILIVDPSFIILDEPTAGQDLRHYREFMEFLLTLNRRRGIALLLITHDMHLMLEYSLRAVVLSGGNPVADAEPFEVLTDDGVIAQARLKRTSLYGLALRAGLPDPRSFVARYIGYERRHRESGASFGGGA